MDRLEILLQQVYKERTERVIKICHALLDKRDNSTLKSLRDSIEAVEFLSYFERDALDSEVGGDRSQQQLLIPPNKQFFEPQNHKQQNLANYARNVIS
jgi:hypothetical protein